MKCYGRLCIQYMKMMGIHLWYYGNVNKLNLYMGHIDRSFLQHQRSGEITINIKIFTTETAAVASMDCKIKLDPIFNRESTARILVVG